MSPALIALIGQLVGIALTDGVELVALLKEAKKGTDLTDEQWAAVVGSVEAAGIDWDTA